MLPTPPPIEPDPADAFPKSWRPFLRSNVFHYRLLRKRERQRLRNDTATFVATKDWEGCRGLSVTDEMKVTVAAQACLMLLGREHDCFSRVRTILLYPSGFRVTDEHWEEEGWDPVPVAGVAVRRGPVILAWDRVLKEGRDPSAGDNVVIHEFAHQLDYIDGYADGTLDFSGDEGEEWNKVLTTEYKRALRHTRRGHDDFLGDYAATSQTEFFATASERFFAQPLKLRHYHPALYAVLAAVYAVEPARWFAKRER